MAQTVRVNAVRGGGVYAWEETRKDCQSRDSGPRVLALLTHTKLQLPNMHVVGAEQASITAETGGKVPPSVLW